MPTWDEVVAIGSTLPGVEAGTSYSTYDGYPYVLVRLGLVGKRQLGELLEDAWRLRAPKRLVTEYDAE